MKKSEKIHPARVLAIGGSDSGGSAGIQADLKTLTANEVFASTAITLLTAQNTVGIREVFPIVPAFIASQIDAVLDDIGTDVFKTGLLGRADVIRMVAEKLTAYRITFPQTALVLDPVLVNGQGQKIVAEDAIHAYRQDLLPLASIITPNLDEACYLAEVAIPQKYTDLYDIARRLHDLGTQTVLIKGGHLAGDEKVDLFFDGQDFSELCAPTLPIQNPHGVGCTFASAIAAGLAHQKPMLEAVTAAHHYLQGALQAALEWKLGAGRSPVKHFFRPEN